MTADVSGEPRGDGMWSAPAAPAALDAAPADATDAVPGRDGPDPTPVTFTQYVDGAWLHWIVAEADAHAVPGALGARCLVFTRRDCIRRVWDYPADWRALDDAGLAALSWHR
jgi:hypothetical protein